MMKAFLVAASMAVASAAWADGGELAFYPFADRANGVKAANDFVITNAVSGSLYGGVVSNAVGWTGGVFFTNAVPGRYLFDGEGYHAAPYASDFGSVFIGGRNNADGSAFGGTWSARVSFDSLASALHDEDHWTVEFFYFLPDNQYLGYVNVLSLDPGYAYNGTPTPINLMPSVKDTWQWRIQTSSNTYPGIFNASTSYYDRWMHIALVYDNGSLGVYFDYTKKVTLAYTKAEAVQNAPLNICNLSARGAFCGLRVMRRALAPTEFLHASDHPTQVDRTAFEWPLEGTVGTVVPDPVAYDDSGDAGLGAPRFVDRKGRLVFIGADTVPARTSAVAVALSIVPKTSSSDLFACGQGLCLPAGSVERILGDFTMEAFMKFDKDEWESKVADRVIDGVAESRKRVIFFGQKFVSDGYPATWSLGLNLRSGVYRPLLSAVLRNGNTNVPVSHEDTEVAVATDGRWHHYAVTYDSATYTMTAYEDGEVLTSTVFDYPLALGIQQEQAAYYVGAGKTLSGHPFAGEVDEVRLSRCVLSPSEFLRMSPVPSGLVILFR